MQLHLPIKKIRNYSIIAFFIPLLTINACLALYNILGNTDIYQDFNWDKKKVEYTLDEYNLIGSQLDKKSFINCPKYKHEIVFLEKGSKKFVVIEQGETLNSKCIKNHKISYQVLSKFNSLEKMLIKVKKESIVGFGSFINPYLYGEMSISRTARFFPATWIFKPFIILSAFFLFLYWKNNLNLFNKITNNNTSNKFSKNFFYLGLFSSIFLALHAIFLGIKLDFQLFQPLRRLIITLFIFFEVMAQISLTMNLVKFREKLKGYTVPIILNIKIIFVTTIFIITLLSLIVLVLEMVETNFKHILEWNYFSVLLVYYMLSRLLWKSPKKT